MSRVDFQEQRLPTSEDWLPSREEGQLSVDVYRDDTMLVIRSTIAGVDPEHIEITIHDDLLTIRGVREANREINEDDWFYQECYWGAFSRSIVLPLDVFPERAEATVKNGILEIRFPIRGKSYRLPIKTIET